MSGQKVKVECKHPFYSIKVYMVTIKVYMIATIKVYMVSIVHILKIVVFPMTFSSEVKRNWLEKDIGAYFYSKM